MVNISLHRLLQRIMRSLSRFVFQEQEENKSATSWPEYYIDQLNSMAAVSNNMPFIYSLDRKQVRKQFSKRELSSFPVLEGNFIFLIKEFLILKAL